MGKYLLLRDNKESGPYLLDDLVRLGLKPYDLVWIEGKSAAWRYPSEVNELKPYAPVAEEQPFDRFYKKAVEDKPEQIAAPHEQTANRHEHLHSPYAPPVAQKEELKFIPRKSVFVTLPGQKSKTEINAGPVDMPKQTPATPTITITESPEVAEVKFSQPLDEIKEMYVKTLQQRKSKNARRGILVANVKKAAVIFGLVLIGVAAGFLIKSKQSKTDNISSQSIQGAPANSLANDIADKSSRTENLSLNDQLQENKQPEKQERAKNSNESSVDQSSIDQQQPVTVRIRKETMIRPAEKKELTNDEQTAPGLETDPLTGERTRAIRSGNSITDKQAVSKVSKKRLNDLVSVSSNDYKRVAFGGIRNLQITVTNNSGFELDHVVVELQYLKPSEDPFRTENIRFQSVSPHTSATIKVPDTNRGIKVQYKIINIESKQNDDAVAGM